MRRFPPPRRHPLPFPIPPRPKAASREPPAAFDNDPMKQILVVDDEPEIARIVRDYLAAAGFGVTTAADGESALAAARPDLVILDLGLPRRDGLDVLRELRRAGDVPVVVLTARGEETDRIVGLELGADDYV